MNIVNKSGRIGSPDRFTSRVTDILSGSDTHDDVVDRLRVFFECGVPQVWIVDPDLRNVTIHRPSGDSVLFTARQTLTAEPELPGFQVAVEALFPKSPAKVS